MAGRTLTAFAAFLLLFTACAPADRDEAEPVDEPTADAPPPELTAATDRYLAAWNGDDPAAVAAFYTENATVTAGDTTYQGRSEIEEDWVGTNQPVVSNLHETESSFDPLNGDWHHHGRYTLTITVPDQEAFEAPGSFSHEWTQDADGEWRIRSSDIRPDQPPQDDQMLDDQAHD